MKKFIILAAAAIMAVAACAKVEPTGKDVDTPIQFSVINHLQQTKATEGLTYPTDVPFGTFAWWTASALGNNAVDQTNVFMDNQEVKYFEASGENAAKWAPSTTYYWTKSGYLTFASYSPYVSATNLEKGFSAVPSYDVTKGFLFENYTIVSATNVDLMYANLAKDCTQNTNANGADVTNDSNPEGGFKGVPTIFNHALCRIGFSFRAAGTLNPNVTAIQVDVKSVEIKNIDKKGSFTQIPATSGAARWSSTHAAANYTDYTYLAATETPINLVLAANPSYTALNVRKILLPQTLVNSGVNDAIATTTDQVLELNYIIKTHYSSNTETDPTKAAYWATEDITSRVRLNNGTIAAWADNQNITYKITINPYDSTPITFDPAVVNWDSSVDTGEIIVTPNAN